jgi:ribosome-associated protein
VSADKELEPRSRTALAKERKAEEKRLAQLASTLVGLSPKQLAKIVLHDSVLEVIDEARRMRSHGARARQLRAVRRELRDNHDVDEVAAVLEGVLHHRAQPTPEIQELQRWAQRFVDEGDAAVEEFLALHGHADRQRLRALLRGARKADPAAGAKGRKTLENAIAALLKPSRV